jgi:hypothetical protein
MLFVWAAIDGCSWGADEVGDSYDSSAYRICVAVKCTVPIKVDKTWITRVKLDI